MAWVIREWKMKAKLVVVSKVGENVDRWKFW